MLDTIKEMNENMVEQAKAQQGPPMEEQQMQMQQPEMMGQDEGPGMIEGV